MNGLELRTDPEHIAVSKSKGVKIDWKDGHHSEYGLDYLRERCPCATCTNVHGGGEPEKPKPPANPLQMYKPALKIAELEPVGNYAVRIGWNDGHKTGIYSYEHLRDICPCAQCAAARG